MWKNTKCRKLHNLPKDRYSLLFSTDCWQSLPIAPAAIARQCCRPTTISPQLIVVSFWLPIAAVAVAYYCCWTIKVVDCWGCYWRWVGERRTRSFFVPFCLPFLPYPPWSLSISFPSWCSGVLDFAVGLARRSRCNRLVWSAAAVRCPCVVAMAVQSCWRAYHRLYRPWRCIIALLTGVGFISRDATS